MFTGIAKPIPLLPPLFDKIAVLKLIKAPLESIKAPP